MHVMDDEQRVDEMIEEGKRVMREAIEEYKPVAICAAYSSGDDSIVSTHFAMSHFDCFVFNADTKVGLSPARCHLKAVCERFKWPLEIREAYAEGPPKRMRKDGHLVPFDPRIVCASGRWVDGDTAYEEACLNHGFPGRGKPQHARMYQRLKERPFRRLLKSLGASKSGHKVLIVSGIRGDESAIRAGYKRTTAAGYFGDVWVNPLYFRTALDFEAYRQEFGLPRNPVKRQCGISGECCCGTFGSVDERAAYRAVDPTFADYLDGLEQRVKANGFPWGWAESPPRWWLDQRKGQGFMFEMGSEFQPMCVGCSNGRR